MAYYDEMQDTLALMTRKNCRGDVPESVNIQTLFEDVNGDLLIGSWKDGLLSLLHKGKYIFALSAFR